MSSTEIKPLVVNATEIRKRHFCKKLVRFIDKLKINSLLKRSNFKRKRSLRTSMALATGFIEWLESDPLIAHMPYAK